MNGLAGLHCKMNFFLAMVPCHTSIPYSKKGSIRVQYNVFIIANGKYVDNLNNKVSVKVKNFINLLLLKKVGSARLIKSDVHPISPNTPAPQYQSIERKKRKGKRVEGYSRNRAAQANKEALALLLKPVNPTPSNTGLARSFQRDTEKGIKVLLYCKVLQRGGA